jgi:hypothetical protein
MSIEKRLEQLEARLQIAEDELAIHRLIASYGPAVDCGDSQAAAALWKADGSYDVGGMSVAAGNAAIAALFDGEQHQGLIREGAAHVLSTPWVRIEGARATAIGYSVVFRRDAGGFVVFRVAANRWELERESDNWTVLRRTNRLLDGAQAARDLLHTV